LCSVDLFLLNVKVPTFDLFFSEEFKAPVGPISIVAPEKYHRFIPKGILKFLVCEDKKSAAKMRKKIGVADIPVITQAYTENVYTHITKNLTDIGKDALEEIHPWIINILVDWANFDQIICKCPLPGIF